MPTPIRPERLPLLLPARRPIGRIWSPSVTGTEADPQVRSRQIATLNAAGVLLAPSNARAAALAVALARG
mgnify:CR=1 FL=1